MREMVTEVIEGETYVFGYLDTDKATEVFVAIAKLGIPTIGASIKDILKSLDFDELEKMQVKDAIRTIMKDVDFTALTQALVMSMEPVAVAQIIHTLCSVVRGTGPFGDLSQDASYKEHFKGRAGDALQVAIKSFEVNRGGHFFASGVTLGGILKKKKASTPAP